MRDSTAHVYKKSAARPSDPAPLRRKKRKKPSEHRTNYKKAAQHRSPQRRTRRSAPEHNKKHKASINTPLLASVVIVFVFVSAYIVNAVGQTITQGEVPTIFPAFGDIAPPQIHRGLIIRNEAVYYAQQDGVLVFHHQDGTRVRPGSLVAEVQDGIGYVEDIHASLNSVEGDIVELQARRGIFDSEINHLNHQIESTIYAHLPRIDRDFSAAYDMVDRTRGIMTLRTQVLTNDDINIRSLVEERDQLHARLGGSVSRIYADEGGVLSYTTDGLESLLSFDNMRTLTPEQVRQSTNPSANTARTVLAGEPAFRIIRSNNWYIALHLPIGVVGGWQQGQVRTVYLEWRGGGWRSLEVVIEELRPYIDTAFVLIGATRFMSDFADFRDIALRLSIDSQDYIQIPIEAVRTMEAVRIPIEYVSRADTATPAVVREGLSDAPAQYIELDIFRRSGDFVYLLTDSNDISPGNVIRHPAGDSPFIIAELTPINGVFLLRFGFADFVDLHMGDSPGYVDGYVIVEAATNPRINHSSQIIQNPAGLQDGQRLIRE